MFLVIKRTQRIVWTVFTRPLHLQPSMGSKVYVPVVADIGRRTHVKPICAILDHPLAFGGELAKVRSENGGGDDCSRHGLSGLQEKRSYVIGHRHR